MIRLVKLIFCIVALCFLLLLVSGSSKASISDPLATITLRGMPGAHSSHFGAMMEPFRYYPPSD